VVNDDTVKVHVQLHGLGFVGHVHVLVCHDLALVVANAEEVT